MPRIRDLGTISAAGAQLVANSAANEAGLVEASDFFLADDFDTSIGVAVQDALDEKTTGPATSTDSNPAVYNGTGGKTLKEITYAAFKAALSLVKGDVGLGNVDNTSDATKNAAFVTLTNKTINASSNTISNLATSMFAANVVDTDGTFAANSDSRLPTQKAVKTGLATKRTSSTIDFVSLEDFGGVGDGVTSDQDAYDDARADGRPIQLVAGKTYLVTDPSNSDGIPLIGQGKLVTAVTGGLRQRNSYADSTRIAWGHEYLDRPFQFMNLGQNSSSGTFRVHLFGDSTVEGGYGEYQTVQAVISAALKRAGIPNHTITNHGAAGTDWSDLDLSGTIGTTVGLIIIKYNINDAGNGLANTITNIRTELAATRAATNGGVGTTPILIVSGSGTSDSPNNRDERWYESLNGVVRQAARDYQCAFFDGYAFMRDARGAAGIWLDNPYADGRAIHPINGTNARFWGAVMDEFFPPYALAAYANNLFTNEGATTSSVAVSVAPNNFNYGLAHYRATTANSWPIDGTVINARNADGPSLQLLFGYGTDSNRVMTRTAATAGNTWNQWTGKASSLTLANSWVNYGGTLGTPKATLTMSGLVQVQGTIKNGTTTGGTVLTTLPAGLRPEADLIFLCSVYSSTDHATIRVKPNGDIVGENGLNASLTSLDNISFMAA